jgi:hypothetical protein
MTLHDQLDINRPVKSATIYTTEKPQIPAKDTSILQARLTLVLQNCAGHSA